MVLGAHKTKAILAAGRLWYSRERLRHSVSLHATHSVTGAHSMVPVRFIVTGFGRFEGQPVNPTEELLNNLQASKDKITGQIPGAHIDAFDVLVVAASTANAWQERTAAQVASSSSTSSSSCAQRTVLLHFGVDGKCDHIKLERCAYNEANFRIPDEDGQQPTKQPICDTQALEQRLDTPLPVEQLQQQLVAQGFDVRISEDAGRYVCNYLYYRSLQLNACHPCQSLFVHVPNTEFVSAERLLQFCKTLMSCIASHAAS